MHKELNILRECWKVPYSPAVIMCFVLMKLRSSHESKGKYVVWVIIILRIRQFLWFKGLNRSFWFWINFVNFLSRFSISCRTSESFSPICLPRYNPMAFLYAYVHYFDVSRTLLGIGLFNNHLACLENYFEQFSKIKIVKLRNSWILVAVYNICCLFWFIKRD